MVVLSLYAKPAERKKEKSKTDTRQYNLTHTERGSVCIAYYLNKRGSVCIVYCLNKRGSVCIVYYLNKRGSVCIAYYLNKRGSVCIVYYLNKRGSVCIVYYLNKRGSVCIVYYLNNLQSPGHVDVHKDCHWLVDRTKTTALLFTRLWANVQNYVLCWNGPLWTKQNPDNKTNATKHWQTMAVAHSHASYRTIRNRSFTTLICPLQTSKQKSKAKLHTIKEWKQS